MRLRTIVGMIFRFKLHLKLEICNEPSAPDHVYSTRVFGKHKKTNQNIDAGRFTNSLFGLLQTLTNDSETSNWLHGHFFDAFEANRGHFWPRKVTNYVAKLVARYDNL